MSEALARSTAGGESGQAAADAAQRRQLPPLEQLKGSFRELLDALLELGVNAAVHAVNRLSEKLEDVTSRDGPVMGAAGGGVKAVVAGKSPMWGAIKGAIGGLSTKTKVLIVLALVLSLLLGPVLLVVLLLALLVLAVVVAVRSNKSS